MAQITIYHPRKGNRTSMLERIFRRNRTQPEVQETFSRPTAPLEMEQIRLESLIRVTFEERHYSHDCACAMCEETRFHLTPQDLHFVNTVSKVMCSNHEYVDDRMATVQELKAIE